MKTILLAFVHGFKGGADTFDGFPDDLQGLLTRNSTLSDVEYRAQVYPPYDTKGDFKLAVTKLRDWLQNTVIDIETERGTLSPTINGSVKVILLGHSMGGLIASDVVIGIHEEYAPSPMFPNVIGVVALDSPMLGLAPSLWTNGADGLLQKGKSMYDNASALTALGSGLFASSVTSSTPPSLQQPKLNSPADQDKEKSTTTTTTGGGGGRFGWKSIAAIGAATALAAGGALYSQKSTIGRGFTWITQHLEFINTLRNAPELSARTVKVNSIESVGFACFFTVLTSPAARANAIARAGGGGGSGERVFIVLPKGEVLKRRFHRQENGVAGDEVAAHTGMFSRVGNDGYGDMLDGVAGEIGGWVDRATAISRQVEGGEA